LRPGGHGVALGPLHEVSVREQAQEHKPGLLLLLLSLLLQLLLMLLLL